MICRSRTGFVGKASSTIKSRTMESERKLRSGRRSQSSAAALDSDDPRLAGTMIAFAYAKELGREQAEGGN
jgi:hypothetical protein